MITTKSGFKNALQESERDAFGNYTWRQAMSNIDYQTKLAEAQAKQLYGEDVATAYQAATQQRAMIGASALGSGSKTLLQQELDDTLSTAYDKYMSNYQSNLASVEAQATKAYSELDKTLEERAANMQTFESEHYKYLQYLDKWRQENALTEDELKDFFDLTAWGNYYKEVPVYDAEGNIISTNRELKSWEDLTTPVRDEVTGEYLSFYDNEGNLTRAGRDFYTKIENYYGQKAIKDGETAIPSFASYLYQANPELYNWANEYNPYSYTPTSTGLSQNIGEFRQLMGIRSDADEYRFIEYYGGLSKKQIDDVFNDIYSKLDTDNVTIDNAVESFQEMRGLAEKLGFTASNTDWEAAEEQVKTIVNKYNDYLNSANAAETSEGFAKTGQAASIAAGIALAIASVTAAVATGGASLAAQALVGTLIGGGGSLAGVGISTAGGITLGEAAKNAEKEKDYFRELSSKTEAELKDMYRGIVASMVADVQRGYTDMAIAEGGVLASKGANLAIGGTYQNVEDWAKATDVPLSDYEYNKYSAQVESRSSNRKDYYVQGLGSGRNNDDIDITIGETKRNTKTEYDLLCGDEVTNNRAIQYLNKYSTGNANGTPPKGKLVVVADKMYIYTARGWRNVIADNDPDTLKKAIKAFLQK